MSKEFKLSAALYGHSLDVRSVAVNKDNYIVSGSRDKTAKFWSPNGINTGYSDVMTYHDQKNFVIAVLYLNPTKTHPDGLIITGGNDNIIYVYKPSEPFASLTLKEHTNAVSCLAKSTSAASFLSGSWDNSAKLWNLETGQQSILTLKAHQAAIWSVIQLKNTQILTASADKSIIMWSTQGQQLKTLLGHTDCVRGLAELSQNQFVSVSNDATVKLWSGQGECLDTYYGHTNYIYSVAARPGAGTTSFVSSDEDRTVRVWENGINTETFQLPAQSVWTVACLANGDIVTGSSDGVVRIFTQDETRYAAETALKTFEEEVKALTKQALQEIGGYKVSDLPGKEALYDPGKTAGQMKMIREGNGVVAYTWVMDGNNSHWEKVGEVLGSANKDQSDRPIFEGKAYDFVFSVDVEDGKPPLKLPYNKGQDPYQAANEFLNKNALPSTYLEEVVNFILKNTNEQYVPQSNDYMDPFTGTSRYTPAGSAAGGANGGVNLDPLTGGSSYTTSQPARNVGVGAAAASGMNADPFTGSSSYSTRPQTMQATNYFPINAFKSFEMGNTDVILSKLKEFNQKSVDLGGGRVDDSLLEQVVKLTNNPVESMDSVNVLFKLLEWPDELVFPVMDVVRLAVRNKKNNEILLSTNHGFLLKKIIGYVNENCKIANNVIVALRTLCNLFLHEHGEELVYLHGFDLVENISLLNGLNKNAQIALSTLLLNLVIAATKRDDEVGISVLAEVIPDMLTRLNDPESQFRLYVALGTLLTATSQADRIEVVNRIKGNVGFASAFQLHLIGGEGGGNESDQQLELKKRNCAKQVENILNRS